MLGLALVVLFLGFAIPLAIYALSESETDATRVTDRETAERMARSDDARKETREPTRR